jgi:hypothetical protein
VYHAHVLKVIYSSSEHGKSPEAGDGVGQVTLGIVQLHVQQQTALCAACNHHVGVMLKGRCCNKLGCRLYTCGTYSGVTMYVL